MSAYGNPPPYATPELERAALEGRIRAARRIWLQAEKAGDAVTVARWSATVDQLLDHLGNVEARAASVALARSSANEGGPDAG